MKHLFPLSSLLLPALLLAAAFTLANAQQPQTGTDPKSPFWIWLPQTGSMTGDSTMSGFGSEIHGVGDVDHSGTQDFLVRYSRTDTVFKDYYGQGLDRHPNQYRLYYGVPGGLPQVHEGIPFRIDGIGAELQYYTAGDWNNDTNMDLAFSYTMFSDTSFSSGQTYAVIFWGNEQGTYSIDDTTQLSNGVGSWTVREMVRMDADNDGIDDLFVRTWGLALMDTGLVATPKGYVLLGREKETWQDNPVWEPTLRWWTLPVGWTTCLDQDADSYDDLIFRYDATGSSVLYAIYGGRSLFDTNDIMMIDLSLAGGVNASLGDVTGDGTPDLLVGTGGEHITRIYAGRRGQRLDEQFGAGFEGPHPERGEWWTRPWAELWMAPKLDDAFTGGTGVSVSVDINLDGIKDIRSGEDPWDIFYVAGDRLDSLIDVFVKAPGAITAMIDIGDIDGSGIPTLAVRYIGPGLLFFKPTTEVSSAGKFRRLPHLPSGVAEEENEQSGFTVQAIPNPSSGEVRIIWSNGSVQGKSATVRITDALGQEVLTTHVPAEAAEFIWDASRTFGGRYFITTMIDDNVETTAVVIR